MLNSQLFWGRWWCHPCRCNSIPWQYTTKAAPHRCLPATIFQGHPECICYPRSRRRRRGRGLPNSPTWWWTLEYARNPWQTFMHSWTFITTWTVSISMSIFRLLDIIILWHLGFKWHLWVWRSDDYIQQWRHPCTQWYLILKKTMLLSCVKTWRSQVYQQNSMTKMETDKRKH